MLCLRCLWSTSEIVIKRRNQSCSPHLCNLHICDESCKHSKIGSETGLIHRTRSLISHDVFEDQGRNWSRSSSMPYQRCIMQAFGSETDLAFQSRSSLSWHDTSYGPWFITKRKIRKLVWWFMIYINVTQCIAQSYCWIHSLSGHFWFCDTVEVNCSSVCKYYTANFNSLLETYNDYKVSKWLFPFVIFRVIFVCV